MQDGRFRKLAGIVFVGAGLALMPAVSSAAVPDGEKIYRKSCKSCHKIEKPGPFPPLLKMQSDRKIIRKTILEGKGFMPPFKGNLSEIQIDAVIEYIQAVQKSRQ